MTNIIKTEKNGEIELFRLLFCLSVVCTHLNGFFHLGLFARGTFGVEFFFLVSGFFMARSAEKAESVNFPDFCKYIYRKAKSFFPYYILAVVLQLIVLRIIIQKTELMTLLVETVKLIPEILFLQMGGFATESTINVAATWYLSAMLLAILVLYPLTIKFKKNYGIIYLILAIFGLGFLNRMHGGYIVVYRTADCGLMYDGMLRGLFEVALGASCYALSNVLGSKVFTKLQKILLTIVKYLGYLFVGVYVFSNFSNTYESIALIVLTICVVLTGSNVTYNIPYNKFTQFCGSISLPLYLLHAVILRCIVAMFGDKNKSVESLIIIVIVVLGLSIALKYALDFTVKLIKKKKQNAPA